MNSASYLLAIIVVGTGIFAFGPHHLGSSNAAYARGDASATQARSASPVATPGEATEDATVVDTKDFAYVPADVTVAAGSTVKFTNSDSIAHTISADDGSFDSKDLSQGQSWSHVFAKAGSFTYYCAYHRYMHGKIVVK